MPVPPRWFVKKLKELNRHFSVRWVESKRLWAINEGVRHSIYQGRHKGSAVYRIGRRPLLGIYVPELGSRVLHLIKSRDPRRYSTIEKMRVAMNIDKNPALA